MITEYSPTRKSNQTIYRTAIYLRLSRDDGDKYESNSISNQRKLITDYIENKPEFCLVDEYVDDGYSGSNFERPAWKRLYEDLECGAVNCIVVKDLSRFGRNYIEVGRYLQMIFPVLGVRLVDINDNFDTLNEWQNGDALTVPMKNLINEMYERDTQRKILATFRAKEKKGERAFFMIPYGYMIDPDCNYHLLVDPDVADYVRLIFRLKASGLGVVAIADRLNQIGAPTPMNNMKSKGKYKNVECRDNWKHSGVLNILKNRTYTGATIYNTHGKGEYKVIPNTHEALVSEETFEAISVEMAERGEKKKEAMKKGKSRSEKYPNVLQGVFYCGDCGRAMSLDKTGLTQVLRNFRYRCGGYTEYRKDDKKAPPCAVKIQSVSDHTVYKFVLDQIRVQLRAGLELEKLESLLGADAKKKKQQNTAIKDKETALKQKIRKLYEDYVDKVITEDEYIEIRSAYSEQLKAVQEQLVSIGNGEQSTAPWAELKKKLFTDDFGGESVGTIQLSEHSSVEITTDDEPDIVERLLRRGLTRELVETMVERLEYSVDGSFSIKFKCEDYVEKLLTMKGA